MKSKKQQAVSGLVRDRILELRRVPAGQLLANPANWRRHGARQRAAMSGVLSEVGYASALLARPLDDGTLQLIDGHLRAEVTPDALVPVLILDVTETEANYILATLDPLAGWAEPDTDALQELLQQVSTSDTAVADLWDDLTSQATRPDPPTDTDDPELLEIYQVVVQCRDEDEQRQVWELLQEAGHRCRLINM